MTMRSCFLQLLFLQLLFSFTLFYPNPLIASAAVPTWEIIPQESKLTFTGIMNGSPVTGEFKKFTGILKGDIDQLAASSVVITIDTGSLSTSYKDLEDTLKSSDWFNVNLFPQAVFAAKQFKKTGDKTYEAEGTLTILKKTMPINVNFTLDSYAKDKAHVTGAAMLKRNDFGIGSGEWASTDEVKNEVKVNFVLSAKKNG